MNETDVRIVYAAARINVGLTQKQASKLLGIGEKTLFNYENGVSVPQWDRHIEMAKLYGIPKEMLCSPRNRPTFIIPSNYD